MSDDEFFLNEEEPEALRLKWETEELQEKMQADGAPRFTNCPHCQKPVLLQSFSCIYCGERVFNDSGPIGKLAYCIRKGTFLWAVLLIVICFMLVSIF